ncbi:MAG: hypothetical protein ACRDIB_17725, partial [Ardenticatenaceae bacterium]
MSLPADSSLRAHDGRSTAERVLARLQPFNLRRVAPGKYRCNSPFRPDSDSGAFALIHDVTGEYGAFYDHVSGEKGSLYQLAARLDVAPTPQHDAPSKRAYEGLTDYASRHNAPTEAFEQAGWHETIYQRRPALAFPTANGMRYRFLRAEQRSYRSVSGYQHCWYRLPRALALA